MLKSIMMTSMCSSNEPFGSKRNDVRILTASLAPRVLSNKTRTNEPVIVKANIIETDKALLKFGSLNGEWFNVNMVCNAIESLLL